MYCIYRSQLLALLQSTEFAAKLVARATPAEPLKFTAEAVTSPVKENALFVARVVAVSALPVTCACYITMSIIDACIVVPAVSVKSPVEAPVAVAVRRIQLCLRFHPNPIKALSESPLSNTMT